MRFRRASTVRPVVSLPSMVATRGKLDADRSHGALGVTNNFFFLNELLLHTILEDGGADGVICSTRSRALQEAVERKCTGV